MTVVGTITLLATIDTSQYKRGANDIEKTNREIEGSANNTEKRSNSAFGKVAKVGLAAVAAGAVAAGAMITKNIGGAIRRVDTLNNSTRVFENLGFNANNVEKAMDTLVESITGLPTPLDEAVRGVQRLASSTGDLDRGTSIYTALNNAVLGLGGSSAEVENAVDAMSQALDGGRLQGQQWQRLITAGLGPALTNLAKEMGITTEELRGGLSDGTIALEDFEAALLDANKNGAGAMSSFEKQAKDATSGIQTSWQNVNTAITRGVAQIVEAIGSSNIAGVIGSMGGVFETVLGGIAEGFRFASEAISVVIEWLQPLINYIRENTALMDTLKNTLILLGGLLLGVVLAGIIAVVAAVALLTAVAEALVGTFTWVMETGIAAWNGIVGAWNGAVGFFSGIWGGITAVFSGVAGFFGRVFGAAMNNIRSVFSGIVGFFSGLWSSIVGLFSRIGTVVGDTIGGAVRGAINAVIGGAVGIINGFIDAINSAVDVINAIPGVSIGNVDRLNVPQLAQGGIVTGPTLALIGEGRESEAVIPLSKLDAMIGGGTNGSGVVVNQYNTLNDNIDMNIATRYLTKELARS